MKKLLHDNAKGIQSMALYWEEVRRRDPAEASRILRDELAQAIQILGVDTILLCLERQAEIEEAGDDARTMTIDPSKTSVTIDGQDVTDQLTANLEPQTIDRSRPEGYPETGELDRLVEISDKSQTIGEFIDWAQYVKGLCLCQECEDVDTGHVRLLPAHIDTQRLLAEFFEIDLDKCEEERQAVLDWVRSQYEQD